MKHRLLDPLQTTSNMLEFVEGLGIRCGPWDSKSSVTVGLWGSLRVCRHMTNSRTLRIFRHRYSLVVLC